MLNVWTVFGGLATLGCITLLLVTIIRLRIRNGAGEPAHADDAVEFSLDRYRPMQRLLSEQDMLFLKQSLGYTKQMGKRWKRQQLGLFKMYLKELRIDFYKLHAEARSIVADTGIESPDFVRQLIHQRIQFGYAVAKVELHLSLASCGLGAVTATPLLQTVEVMRMRLQTMAPRPTPTLVR